MPGTVLDTEDTGVNKTKSLCSHRAYILVRREILLIEGNKYNEEKKNRLGKVKRLKMPRVGRRPVILNRISG